MHCFCLNSLKKDPARTLSMRFKDIDPEDKHKYCNEWFINYAQQNAMVYGTSLVVVAINVIICFSFEMISKLERHHTQNDETMGMFQKITIMQFINIACIVLLVNFNLTAMNGQMLFGFVPILNGEYNDFTVQWYYNVGVTLCFTLLLNVFSPHAGKLIWPVISCLARCFDRGCGCTIKKNPANKSDDQVRTNKEFQSDLQTLYTGPQISGHYVYA